MEGHHQDHFNLKVPGVSRNKSELMTDAVWRGLEILQTRTKMAKKMPLILTAKPHLHLPKLPKLVVCRCFSFSKGG